MSLQSYLLNDSLSVSGITGTSRKFILVRWYYERKISDESQPVKIFMPKDTKKCNDRQENTLIPVIIKGILFRNNSCTCIVYSLLRK